MSGVESSSLGMSESDIDSVSVTPCNIPLENFTTLFNNLTLSDFCPSCHVQGARHLLRDVILNNAGVNVTKITSNKSNNANKFQLDPTSVALMKVKKELPTF